MVSDFRLTVNSAPTTHRLHQRDRVPRAIGKFREQSIHTYSITQVILNEYCNLGMMWTKWTQTETAVEVHFLLLKVSVEPGQHSSVRAERPGMQQQTYIYLTSASAWHDYVSITINACMKLML